MDTVTSFTYKSRIYELAIPTIVKLKFTMEKIIICRWLGFNQCHQMLLGEGVGENIKFSISNEETKKWHEMN